MERKTLSRNEWLSILRDQDITSQLDLEMFQHMHMLKGNAGRATLIAHMLCKEYGELNLEVGAYAKRINAAGYDIGMAAREAEPEKYKFWDLFFNGYEDGSGYVWVIREELLAALEWSQLCQPNTTNKT